mgnify:CR=1 FL=1
MLRSKILELLRQKGPLTAKQICRILNKKPLCPLHYNPKTGWMDRNCQKCTIKLWQVQQALKNLEARGLVVSFYAYVWEEGPRAQKNYSGELYKLYDAKDHFHPELIY